MKRVKVFISQPMMNKPNDILQQERAKLVEELESQGHEVLDSVFDLQNGTPLQYLAKSIEIMDKADAVIMMKGWEESRGCNMEYNIAISYNKFVKFQ